MISKCIVCERSTCLLIVLVVVVVVVVVVVGVQLVLFLQPLYLAIMLAAAHITHSKNSNKWFKIKMEFIIVSLLLLVLLAQIVPAAASAVLLQERLTCPI